MSGVWHIVQGVVVGSVFLAFPILAHYSTASFGWIYFVQHAGTNAVLGWIFGRSLCNGREPLCSRFAAIVHGLLSTEVARYTRYVTIAWTVFFVLMVSVSALLFFLAPIDAWSVFANFVTPIVVVLMFVIEYGIRLRVLPSMQHATILESVRAFRNSPFSLRSR